MQMHNSAQAISVLTQPAGMDTYNTDVPGKLRWFEPGSSEYQSWVEQRSKFIKEIDTGTSEGKEILSDILDSLLESEIPSGIISTILVFLKITKSARTMHKRRQIWYKVIDAVPLFFMRMACKSTTLLRA